MEKSEGCLFVAFFDIKKVYTIILFEQSTQAFHKLEGEFIHRGKTTFNTGLELELLLEEAKGKLQDAKEQLADTQGQLADKDRQIEELTKLVKQFQNM